MVAGSGCSRAQPSILAAGGNGVVTQPLVNDGGAESQALVVVVRKGAQQGVCVLPACKSQANYGR